MTTFQATVMLAVNVSFLAIPGVVPSDSDASNLTSPRRILVTFVQIASFSSILTSVGSIVIGLSLVRFNGTKPKEGLAGTLAVSE